VTTLVLASSSEYRRRLLAEAGMEAISVAPEFDERSLDASFAEWGVDRYVVEVATGKARSVSGRVPPGVVVVAADQVAVLDGALMTKPGTPERAVEQLVAMSGRTHELVNGVVVIGSGARVVTAVDRHLVTMRPYGRAEAVAYVEAFRPLDCVGSYRIEDDADLIESVAGSGHDGVIGLPLAVVRRLVAEVSDG
jgi:septum formation protein